MVANLRYFLDSLFPDTEYAKEPRHLYVVEFNNKVVKVGMTKNINQRLNNLEKEYGEIIKWKYWPPINNAYTVEQQIHRVLRTEYSNWNNKKEFYLHLSFNDAVDIVNRICSNYLEVSYT